jgi:Na+-driven multidrug efflux pump
VLAAVEVGLVNNLLGGETISIAAFGVYQTVERLALMPTIACSAAVVPFAARLLPRREVSRIRSDLGRTLLMAWGFAVLVTGTLGIVFGEPLARAMIGDEGDPIDLEQRVALATRIFRLLPISVLATAPFLLLRPMFEAAQRPRLGVRVSVVRFLALSIPLILLGRFAAPSFGFEELTGILVGLISATSLASLITWALVRREIERAAAA